MIFESCTVFLTFQSLVVISIYVLLFSYTQPPN